MYADLAKVIQEKGVLVKISGKALGEEDGRPFSMENVKHIVNEICKLYDSLEKPQIAIVVGGGNIWRGAYGEALEFDEPIDSDDSDDDQPASDEVGIFATMTNAMYVSLAFARKLGANRVKAILTSEDRAAEVYSRKNVKKALKSGKIVVLGGGIGTTGITTDSVAVIRAKELGLGAVLMAKDGTDGVYDRRPEEEGARKYATLSYRDYILNELKIADLTAIAFAKERSLPLMFFDFSAKGGLQRIANGERVGTLVYDVPTSFDI